MKTVLIVGSMAYDEIETPRGRSGKILGGAATYSALAASYFDVDVKMLSVVGEDFKQEYFDILSNHGIDISGIEVKKGEKTFHWAGKYLEDMNQRKTLLTDLNVLENFDPVVPDNFKNPEILLLGNLSPRVQLSVINQLESKPKLIVLDTMNFWITTALDELQEVISKVDLLTINEEEAYLLSGEYTVRAAAEKILKMGPRFLIIKKGEHGAMLFDKQKMFFAPALPLYEVFDPTGAGDTFAGGLCGFMAFCGDYGFENLKNGVIAGSVLASFTVESFGTDRLRSVDEDEIYSRIDEFIELVSFNFPKKDIIFNTKKVKQL